MKIAIIRGGSPAGVSVEFFFIMKKKPKGLILICNPKFNNQKKKEIYRMKNGKVISKVVEKLKEKYRPKSVILFGSYAYGNPKEDSDIDLLIIKDTKKERVERFVEVKKVIYDPNFRTPISPLVYTPKELKKRIQMGDQFIKEIVEKGKVLYDDERRDS